MFIIIIEFDKKLRGPRVMQQKMRNARRCTALLPCALPLGHTDRRTDRHSAVLIRLSICGLRNNKHTNTHDTALFRDYPRKPIQSETVEGSGISWAICKSAPRSRQTTTPAPRQGHVYILTHAVYPVVHIVVLRFRAPPGGDCVHS